MRGAAVPTRTTRRVAYRIGLVGGLLVGVVGIVQWIGTARDLAERFAAYQVLLAHLRQYPDPYAVDTTNVVMNNQWYWHDTAAWVVLALELAVFFVAFVAARAAQRWQEGGVAAGVVILVSSAIYIAASMVVHVTGPFSADTAGILVMEVFYGVPLVGVTFIFALLAAGVGESEGKRAGHPLQGS